MLYGRHSAANKTKTNSFLWNGKQVFHRSIMNNYYYLFFTTIFPLRTLTRKPAPLFATPLVYPRASQTMGRDPICGHEM